MDMVKLCTEGTLRHVVSPCVSANLSHIFRIFNFFPGSYSKMAIAILLHYILYKNL